MLLTPYQLVLLYISDVRMFGHDAAGFDKESIYIYLSISIHVELVIAFCVQLLSRVTITRIYCYYFKLSAPSPPYYLSILVFHR